MINLLTIAELQRRTEPELRTLFRTVSEGLTRSAPGTPDRRNSLATLENIETVLRNRQTRPAPAP